MKLNEYLAENAVKLMIKGSGEKNPTRQTNGLGMYDYVENRQLPPPKRGGLYPA